MHCRALLCALLAALPAAAAQVVTGNVVQSNGATPLSGVIVLAIDARGANTGRALTNNHGSFSLKLAAPGSVTLTVLRIGYRPTVGPTVTVENNAERRVQLVVADVPVTLAASTVREKETCRVNADTGLLVARVWEEARKAMLSSQLASDSIPLIADWIEYSRTLDSASSIVRNQEVKSGRHSTTHAFTSVPADALRDQGFVVDGSTGINYFAPDAEVLLSETFVSGHCFRLVTTPVADTRLIGVGFVPSQSRRSLREIEGILWVDRTNAELRFLEFRYINLPEPSSAALPGGSVEFRRLADGNWLVNRWNIRMPEIAPRVRGTGNYLRAVHIVGGEVTAARRGDSVMFSGRGPAISLQLTSRDPHAVIGGSTLTLDGTDYAATADSLGHFYLSPVLAGRYRVRVTTPLMAQFELPAVDDEVEATVLEAHVDSITVPSGRQLLARLCPSDQAGAGRGMFFGQVTDARARPVSDAVVRVTWKTDEVPVLTNETGTWRACGIPLDTPVSVSVTSNSGVAQQRIDPGSIALLEVDLKVRVPPRP